MSVKCDSHGADKSMASNEGKGDGEVDGKEIGADMMGVQMGVFYTVL